MFTIVTKEHYYVHVNNMKVLSNYAGWLCDPDTHQVCHYCINEKKERIPVAKFNPAENIFEISSYYLSGSIRIKDNKLLFPPFK